MNRKSFLESLFGWSVAFAGAVILHKGKPIGALQANIFPWVIDTDDGWHHYLYSDGKYYLDGEQIPSEKSLLQVGRPSTIQLNNASPYNVSISSFIIHENHSAQLWAKIDT